jgi:hypothetical protein
LRPIRAALKVKNGPLPPEELGLLRLRC